MERIDLGVTFWWDKVGEILKREYVLLIFYLMVDII